MAKTVVALYQDVHNAYEAMRELMDNGFDRQDVGILANNAQNQYNPYFKNSGEYAGEQQSGSQAGKGVAEGAGIGALVGGISGLGIGLGLLAVPGVGPVMAAGYWAAALIGTGVGAGVGATAGGIIGALVGAGVPKEQANMYAEGVRRGGTLVTVKTSDEQADRASAILKRHNPIDTEKEAANWRRQGWNAFDENAGPYTGPGFEQMPTPGMDTASARHGLAASTPTPGMATGTTPAGERGERQPDVDFGQNPTPGMETASARHGLAASTPTPGMATGTTPAGERGEGKPDFNEVEPYFRNQFQTTYGSAGYDFNRYLPAYRFGYDNAIQTARPTPWLEAEPRLRQEWQRSHPTEQWDAYQQAVRQGWERGNVTDE